MNTTCIHPTTYPSDITDDEWAILAPYVNNDPKIGSPRDVCIRCVINALLYVHKTGCQWLMIPSDLPNYGTVYYYFRKWSRDGTLERINYDLIARIRLLNQREPEPSLVIVDSQSVKTTAVGGDVGYDANKKIKGRKRHIFVDTLGLILAITVTNAGVVDAVSAPMLGPKMVGKWSRIVKCFADQGYKNQFCAWIRAYLGWDVEIVVKPPPDPQRQGFQVIPKRWIVERTFAWFGHYRRLSNDYEYYTDLSESMVLLASIRRMIRLLTKNSE